MSTSVVTPSSTHALALAAENAAANRRSSASSSSSDLNDHGMPVVPFYHGEASVVAHALTGASKPLGYEPSSSSVSESEPSSASETSTLEPSLQTQAHTAANSGGTGLRLSLQSPTSIGANRFSFEEIMSPRHQNGKRYLGGYLNQRVSMAGGFLKSWKRKYFRLRDHGILCFKHEDDTTPLFEIHFKAQSLLLVDKPLYAGSGTGTPTGGAKGYGNGYEDMTMLAATKSKVNASLLLILKHIEVQGHQTPANKVDVPIYLKAENETEFHAWVENVRLKMEARKRALTHDTVDSVLSPQSAAVASEGDAGLSRVSDSGAGTPQPPPTRRLGSTGDSVSFSERHESALALDIRNEMSPTNQDRTVTMNVLSPTVRSGSLSQAAPHEKNKLLFVAGATPDPPEFATFRAKYLLMKEIGEGSFSIVHRAVNRLTGQLCAIKCCKHSPALDEEVSILRKLSHPNVVGLEGVYMQDEMYYVVMDYMEEGDLCERLIQKQRFTEAEAKQIITQVVRGLEYLHRNNVLHRDLKPENILLHGNIVKIADFGLARQLPAATSMLKRSCGTLEYAAPELLRGQAYGLKSDIFSLGVVLYVLLFGAFPFTIESAAALQRMERFPGGVDVRDMSCLNRDNGQWKQVSTSAQDVLLRMLCPNDKERVSAKDLLAHPWFDSTRTVYSLAVQPVDDSAGFRRDSGMLIHDMNAEERESERIQDCRAKGFIELLSRGLDMIKYGKNGNTSPHLATVVVDFVHGTISWTARAGILGMGGAPSSRKVTDNTQSPTTASSNKRGARLVSLSDVQEIRVGHTTEAFRSAATGGRDLPPANLCVSIVATWRTLDLVVRAGVQCEFIVTGLRNALEQYRSKHKTQ